MVLQTETRDPRYKFGSCDVCGSRLRVPANSFGRTECKGCGALYYDLTGELATGELLAAMEHALDDRRLPEKAKRQRDNNILYLRGQGRRQRP